MHRLPLEGGEVEAGEGVPSSRAPARLDVLQADLSKTCLLAATHARHVQRHHDEAIGSVAELASEVRAIKAAAAAS
jgi:hypothetical protein